MTSLGSGSLETHSSLGLSLPTGDGYRKSHLVRRLSASGRQNTPTAFTWPTRDFMGGSISCTIHSLLFSMFLAFILRTRQDWKNLYLEVAGDYGSVGTSLFISLLRVGL